MKILILHPNSRKQGFVLIELLAALMITTLIISTVSVGFATGQKVVYQNSIVAEMQNSARESMQYLTGEIRASQKILAVSSNSLTLINHNNNKIVYRKGGSTLWRDFYQYPASTIKSTSHPLSNQITELHFDSCGNNGVKIRLTTGVSSKSFTLETVMFLRVN